MRGAPVDHIHPELSPMTLLLNLFALWWLFELVYFIYGSIRYPTEDPDRMGWAIASSICLSVAILVVYLV